MILALILFSEKDILPCKKTVYVNFKDIKTTTKQLLETQPIKSIANSFVNTLQLFLAGVVSLPQTLP